MQAMRGTSTGARSGRATSEARDPQRHKFPLSLVATLAIVGIVALAISVLDFMLIVGAVPIPVPGLQAGGSKTPADTATYGFERGTSGWSVRGCATNAVLSNDYVFAGQNALEFHVTNLSNSNQAYVFTTLPRDVKPGTKVVAHVYVPAGAPVLVATIYALDSSWRWHSGPFPALAPGQWTAVAYTIPATFQAPVRELGIMLVTSENAPPYSGLLFVDSIDVQGG